MNASAPAPRTPVKAVGLIIPEERLVPDAGRADRRDLDPPLRLLAKRLEMKRTAAFVAP